LDERIKGDDESMDEAFECDEVENREKKKEKKRIEKKKSTRG
jgi:hypothetical protein